MFSCNDLKEALTPCPQRWDYEIASVEYIWGHIKDGKGLFEVVVHDLHLHTDDLCECWVPLDLEPKELVDYVRDTPGFVLRKK